ncbi:type I pantothenate kinase [Paenibacillus marinisediminis]
MKSFSPYLTLERNQWATLYDHMQLSLTSAQFERLLGLNERILIDEAEEVYLPLTKLIHIHVAAAKQLRADTTAFMKQDDVHVPYIIGIAGSVAAGKSTTARLLQALLSQCEDHPRVDIVTTDGFLYPNKVLEERGIMNKKGFPQSYDMKKLIQFLTDVKAGYDEVHAPVYSHQVYDIVEDETIVVRKPDILILEGINVLQVNKTASVFVSDFFDFSIYVDAPEQELEHWYMERFLLLRETAFQNPDSYFHRFTEIDKEDAVQIAKDIWQSINHVNLKQNIYPTKSRAKLILCKGEDHRVEKIMLRK